MRAAHPEWILSFTEPFAALVFGEEHRYAGSLAAVICCHVNDCNLWDIDRRPFTKAEEMVGFGIREDWNRSHFAAAENLICFRVAQTNRHRKPLALAMDQVRVVIHCPGRGKIHCTGEGNQKRNDNEGGNDEQIQITVA